MWNRTELRARDRDRSLITIAALVAGGNTDHLGRAKENGITEAELIETITHQPSTRAGQRP